MHHDDTSERWLAAESFPGYEVSSCGRVLSRKRSSPRVLQPREVNGYMLVQLFRDGRHVYRYVHRLVLEAFVGPCPDGMEAAHRDGVCTNNCLGNLLWTTPQENHSHKRAHGTDPRGERNPRARLTPEQVVLIRQSALCGCTQRELAVRFEVAESTIQGIVCRRLWKDV